MVAKGVRLFNDVELELGFKSCLYYLTGDMSHIMSQFISHAACFFRCKVEIIVLNSQAIVSSE